MLFWAPFHPLMTWNGQYRMLPNWIEIDTCESTIWLGASVPRELRVQNNMVGKAYCKSIKKQLESCFCGRNCWKIIRKCWIFFDKCFWRIVLKIFCDELFWRNFFDEFDEILMNFIDNFFWQTWQNFWRILFWRNLIFQ